MTDLIVLVVLAVIISLAALYVYKEKKRGTVCVGCPHAQTCAHRKTGGCSGHTDTEPQA